MRATTIPCRRTKKEGRINMELKFILNGTPRTVEISTDTLLLDLLRSLKCYSVKRGCETGNCGLCTVFMDDKPVLSCSTLAARVEGRSVVTLEGLREEAEEYGAYIADEGAEQCGFCNPGLMMNAIALYRENPHATDDEIKEYLAGNLCRCSGYEGQLRGIRSYLEYKNRSEQNPTEICSTPAGAQKGMSGTRETMNQEVRHE